MSVLCRRLADLPTLRSARRRLVPPSDTVGQRRALFFIFIFLSHPKFISSGHLSHFIFLPPSFSSLDSLHPFSSGWCYLPLLGDLLSSADPVVIAPAGPPLSPFAASSFVSKTRILFNGFRSSSPFASASAPVIHRGRSPTTKTGTAATRPQPAPPISTSWIQSRAMTTSSTSSAPSKDKWKVAIIGSGNWGSAIARLIGINVQAKPHLFEPEVRMWVFEEKFNDRPLTEQFNELHENVKYLPGVKIPSCVIADPDLLRTVEGANALVFVTPHAFVPGICKQLQGKIRKDCRALSLVKGVEVNVEKISIFAQFIEEQLGIPCGALSGANIADEVARDRFGETTIACKNEQEGQTWFDLFNTPTFRVQVTDDVVGVSLAGALKNVVAIAAGACDGLEWGNNAKAAIMRIGLLEMRKFALEFFDDARPETFVHSSAGIADLITSCLGGRNRKCGEAFVRTGKSFDVLEREMLNGQKLQGVETAKEVHEFLKARGKVDDYPLFRAVYRMAFEGLEPKQITAHL